MHSPASALFTIFEKRTSQHQRPPSPRHIRRPITSVAGSPPAHGREIDHSPAKSQPRTRPSSNCPCPATSLHEAAGTAPSAAEAACPPRRRRRRRRRRRTILPPPWPSRADRTGEDEREDEKEKGPSPPDGEGRRPAPGRPPPPPPLPPRPPLGALPFCALPLLLGGGLRSSSSPAPAPTAPAAPPVPLAASI